MKRILPMMWAGCGAAIVLTVNAQTEPNIVFGSFITFILILATAMIEVNFND